MEGELTSTSRPSCVSTTSEGVCWRILLRSLRKAPKKGTTRHSGSMRARSRAASYSPRLSPSSTPVRKSSTGRCSLSRLNQKGFSFSDLQDVQNCNNSASLICMGHIISRSWINGLCYRMVIKKQWLQSMGCSPRSRYM